LYAEDPAKGFLPSVGKLEHFHLSSYNTRIETGFEAGDKVTPFYDPMLAKLVVHGENRAAAAEQLSNECAAALVWPVRTNSSFLSRALEEGEFVSGNVDTGFIERHQSVLCTPAQADEKTLQIGVSEVLKRATYPSLSRRQMREQPFAIDLRGIRLNADRIESYSIAVNGLIQSLRPNYNGNTAWNINYTDDGGVLVSAGQLFHFGIPRTEGSAHGPASTGTILSPMPGKIIAVEVAQGQAVTKGQKLLTLEAMKMEHTLTAPFDGVVAELNAEAGGQVQVEAVLARIAERNEAAEA
jgi:3-methylcrotonyl-CoA carboxylase alpha subunit